MHIFITGICGFIGFHTAQKLVSQGHTVSGCDTLNDYYSPALKTLRKTLLSSLGIPVYSTDCSSLSEIPLSPKPITHVLHLAAQAGVRYSLTNPDSYMHNNLSGTFGVLEFCKRIGTPRLVFASSSSVYGLSTDLPFTENDPADKPANFYAATKRSTEHMAFSYHHTHGIPMCGLRFFTVYGPYGRPDMAYYSFAKKICEEKEITLYGNGEMERDFTYIDDIVNGILAALSLDAPWEIINLGNSSPEKVTSLLSHLERSLGKKAHIKIIGSVTGEVRKTWANIEKAKKLLNFNPQTSLEEGINRFCTWFRQAPLEVR